MQRCLEGRVMHKMTRLLIRMILHMRMGTSVEHGRHHTHHCVQRSVAFSVLCVYACLRRAEAPSLTTTVWVPVTFVRRHVVKRKYVTFLLYVTAL